jgi:glycosyltransferase involved in cell wall biosynthesis
MQRISVVIPTYNRLKMVDRALSSVCKQTLNPAEIIVIDDGSQDSTKDLILNAYPQVKYIRQNRQGVSAARNTGIKIAKGDWVALLDSDDEWLPTKLEKQMAMAQREPSISFIHCDEIWFRNGKHVNQKKHHKKTGGELFSVSLLRCMISPSSVIIKKKLLELHKYFDEQLPACEDYDLWLRITARESVGFVDEPLVYKHGGHADQLSSSMPILDQYRVQSLYKILLETPLTPPQRQEAKEVLRKKLEIVLNGAKKRGRNDIITRIEKIKWNLLALQLF